jgi:hypothetical protein
VKDERTTIYEGALIYDPEGQKMVARGDRGTREPSVYPRYNTAPAGAGDRPWLRLHGDRPILAFLPGCCFCLYLTRGSARASHHPWLISGDPPGRQPHALNASWLWSVEHVGCGLLPTEDSRHTFLESVPAVLSREQWLGGNAHLHNQHPLERLHAAFSLHFPRNLLIMNAFR